MRHLLLSLAVIAGLAGATQASAADLYGRWKNPKNSVHVDIRPCGESACGYVVWALTPAAHASNDRHRAHLTVGA